MAYCLIREFLGRYIHFALPHGGFVGG